MKRTLVEAGLVFVCGLTLSLAVNAVWPRGLNLNRDYFPPPPSVIAQPGPSNATTGTTSVATARQTLAERLRAEGFRLVEHAEVVSLYQSPAVMAQKIIFVDARNDEHYQAGHVPGAWQFDHYHPENYIAAVFPACQLAEQIVVYCAGGDCEDSEFAARTLFQASVPKERLLIYGGGFTEWEAKGQPVETGARNSGVFRPAKQ